MNAESNGNEPAGTGLEERGAGDGPVVPGTGLVEAWSNPLDALEHEINGLVPPAALGDYGYEDNRLPDEALHQFQQRQFDQSVGLDAPLPNVLPQLHHDLYQVPVSSHPLPDEELHQFQQGQYDESTDLDEPSPNSVPQFDYERHLDFGGAAPGGSTEADLYSPEALRRFQADQYRHSYDPELIASRGPGYREWQLVDHTHYKDPIKHAPGEPSGYSRRVGDAPLQTQLEAIHAIIAAGRDKGMTDRQIALTLAIAHAESGFNPDAAAGTSSAAGLGQFTDGSAPAYGLDDGNRFDLKSNASALVRETMDNMKLAEDHKHHGAEQERYAYAYHHDGPNGQDAGKKKGLALADHSVMPLIDRYQRSLPEW